MLKLIFDCYKLFHARYLSSPMHEFIIDSYTLRRGTPAMLELRCSACSNYLMTYQKDGPGPLLRCYWDRIHEPENLKKSRLELIEISSLSCGCCSQLIGTKSLYEKEQRLAFTLVEGSFQIKELE